MSDFVKKFISEVKQGNVPGFSIDKDNPAMQYESMDIYAKPGTKIQYTGFGGYDSDKAYADNYLIVNELYIVSKINVRDYSSDVRLEEFPDRHFNTVMFAKIDSTTQSVNTCGFCRHYEVIDPEYMTNPCDRDGEEREPTDTCIGWDPIPVSSGSNSPTDTPSQKRVSEDNDEK